MKNHETVLIPSVGQLLELSAAVLKQLPKDLLPEEAQYWIGHQSRLGEVLRQALKISSQDDLYWGGLGLSNHRWFLTREVQLSRLIQLGYPEAAGMTKEAFTKLIPIPEDKEGALLVVPANIISIDKQMKLIGGRNNLNLNSLKDTVLTHDTPYWIYGVENGKKMLGKSPDTCVQDFAKQRRGLTAVEGSNLIAQYPDVLKDHYIDLPGSRSGADRVPCLFLYFGRPRLCCNLSGYANSNYGSASCLR